MAKQTPNHVLGVLSVTEKLRDKRKMEDKTKKDTLLFSS